jgi:hypothetical protein
MELMSSWAQGSLGTGRGDVSGLCLGFEGPPGSQPQAALSLITPNKC